MVRDGMGWYRGGNMRRTWPAKPKAQKTKRKPRLPAQDKQPSPVSWIMQILSRARSGAMPFTQKVRARLAAGWNEFIAFGNFPLDGI